MLKLVKISSGMRMFFLQKTNWLFCNSEKALSQCHYVVANGNSKNSGIKSYEYLMQVLSFLEGQNIPVSDIELNALTDVVKVSVNWLLGRSESSYVTY